MLATEKLDARLGSGGPSMPGKPKREDATGRRARSSRRARPASRSSAPVRRVVVGELQLPDADPVEPGGGIRRDVLSNDALTVEISESESFIVLATDCCKRCPTTGTLRGASRKSGLRELLVDEVAGACAEARARVGRRADVPEVVDRRPMSGRLRERPEEEVLVERAGAAVDVAADEVDVQCRDVGGGEDDARERRPLEVLDVAAEARRDPVGVRLPELLRPGAVADVELVLRHRP